MPWCTVIIRNAFGVAGAVHQHGQPLNWRYAWPSARWGSLPLEGGIEAAYRADIDAAEDPRPSWRRSKTRLNKLRSPLRSAETFWIEEIIDPRQTRRLLCEFAGLAERVLEPGMRARHPSLRDGPEGWRREGTSPPRSEGDRQGHHPEDEFLPLAKETLLRKSCV